MNNIKKIIYNCRQATYLIDKRMERKLTFKEAVSLRLHLINCDVCKRYVKQSQKIDEMIKQLFKVAINNPIQLDDTFKAGLQTRIEDQLNKN